MRSRNKQLSCVMNELCKKDDVKNILLSWAIIRFFKSRPVRPANLTPRCCRLCLRKQVHCSNSLRSTSYTICSIIQLVWGIVWKRMGGNGMWRVTTGRRSEWVRGGMAQIWKWRTTLRGLPSTPNGLWTFNRPSLLNQMHVKAPKYVWTTNTTCMCLTPYWF